MMRSHVQSVLLILALVFPSLATSYLAAMAAPLDLYPASSRCVCGPQQIDVMLFDFKDVTHASENTPNHYRSIVAEMNASFYRQSYGKMWLVGGEVHGWYDSNLALAPWNVTTWDIDWNDAHKLEKVANDRAIELHLKGYKIAVFAGDVWAWTIAIGGRTMIVGEKRWGFATYMHEFMHMVGLPDLYAYGESKPQDVEMAGEWDLMDRGKEELSAYSRMRLGWLDGDAVAATTTKNPSSFSVNSLDATTGVRALKVKAPTGDSFYYLVETRRKTDGLHLVIYYVPAVSGTQGGALLLRAVLGTSPDAERVYFGDKWQFSLILLDRQGDGLLIRVSSKADGEKAQLAVDALQHAVKEIDTAAAQNRMQGLSEAKDALDKAWEFLHEGAFDASRASAENSIVLAQSARWVPQTTTSTMSTKALGISRGTTSQEIGAISMWASPVIIVGVVALILIAIGIAYLRRRPPTEDVLTRKFCINCGTSLPSNALTCEKCGSSQS